MVIYQHDSTQEFRFDLRGRLEDSWVEQLENAWQTARSILTGKELIVDVSRVTFYDRNGLDLLMRMRAAGARVMLQRPDRRGIIAWLRARFSRRRA